VDPAVIERGAYLANNVMGCPICHTPVNPDFTPRMDMAYAGGLEIPEPFGTWRSPNITQDRKTGIGGWKDEEIIVAIREGKRPDGSQMFPIMPYLYYNRLSDADAKALVTFLRTVKPVENQVAGTPDLKLPKIPAPKPAGAEPAADEVARGDYLATLMTCAHCHSPVTKEGAPDMSRAYAGGAELHLPPVMGTGALFAPNLTPHPKTGLQATEEQIVAAIMEGKKIDGSPIYGPMSFLGNAWRGMKKEDALAVARFLKSLKPIDNKVPASTFKPAAPPPGPQK
jgi:mono/diheme cytochrome c family protein